MQAALLRHRLLASSLGAFTTTLTARITQLSSKTIQTSGMAATTRRSSARISARAQVPAQVPAQVVETVPKPPSRKRKTSTTKTTEPSTPPRKKTQATGSKKATPVTPVVLPPATPTPTAAGLFAEPTASTRKKPRSATVTRIADPKLTNATLLSPETSRLVASKDVESVSPTKSPQARTTTDNLLKDACEHLIKIDERMRPLVEQHHCRIFSPEGLAEKIDPFENLTSGIMSQQVSGAAAKSIKGKFLDLFDEKPNGRFPHPSQVASKSIEELRTAGLSQRKAEYIKGLAEKFTSGELSAQMLHDASDEEVMEKLIAVRGLGKWSVEMFACFGLKRMDVFSLGDLGVQRGMAAFVGRDVAKLKSKGGKWKYMSEQDMIELSNKFAPYRSLFMWYMWRVEETDVSTLE